MISKTLGSRRRGATQPALSRAGLAHWLAVALEPLALRGADFITSVSEGQNAEMVARYPWLDTEKMAAIPIGGDPDDFVALSDMPTTQELLDDERDRIAFDVRWHVLAPCWGSCAHVISRVRAAAFIRTCVGRTHSYEFRRYEQSTQ